MIRSLSMTFLSVLVSVTPLAAREVMTAAGPLQLTMIADDFDEPWAVEALPDGGILVTERDGALWYLNDGARNLVRGVPQVVAQGQGGLLDVMIPQDFATSRDVFLTYSKQQNRGSGTALAVGQLSDDGTKLENTRTLWEMAQGSSGGRHFGSRVIEGADGKIYLTIGDRGDRDSAQDLAIESGTVVRLNRDGSIPADNPFVGQDGARPGIWSYGHRNPQGLAAAADGTIYAVEHGARGGDEVNLVKRGANFGWPVISYGRHYSGFKIGEGKEKPGMEQPEHYWDPSIAPSGAVVHSGQSIPDWRGQLFVGSLKFDYIARLDPDRGMAEVEQLQFPETGRVRDVIEAPDGALWFLSVHDGALYRLGR